MAASPLVYEPVAIIVMGVSGCGKSSVGAAIADAYGWPFLEGDALHPQENIDKMSKGTPLTDADRWPWLERIASDLMAAAHESGGAVASCSSLRRAYRDLLRDRAGLRLVFVFLDGSEDLLTSRMAARKGHFMPVSLLRTQFAALERPTGEADVVTIDISGSTADVIALALAELAKMGLPGTRP